MIDTVPDHFQLYALLVFFALAVAVVVLGAVFVVRRGLALKKKVVALKKLPFAPALELAQARVAIATRSIDRVPVLVARAQKALATISSSRDRVTASALEVRDVVRALLTRG